MALVTHQIHTAELRRLLHGRDGAVTRDIFRRGLRVLAAMKRLCPVDTGRLRSSLAIVVVIIDGLPAALVGTNVKYAVFVLHGTGLYGPHKHVIVPKRARVLVFKAASGGVVFAKFTRGSPPNDFMRPALLAARG